MASAFQAINRSSKSDSNDSGVDSVANAESTTDHSAAPTASASASASRTASQEPATAPVADSRLSESQDLAGNDTTIYGTRSRNRTGNARPNYSEDQDYDYDFVSSAATTTTTTAATAKKSSQSAQNANNGATKRAAALDGTDAVDSAAQSRNRSPSSQTAKDTSGSAIASAAANPKKRKAAANAQNPQTSSTAANSATGSAALRKTATAASTANARDIAMMTFSKSKAMLNKKGELVADDGTKLCVDDHVYLVCEPPGDPYYLCRIMEFLHTHADDPTSPIDSLRVNWYYRPRDVQRFNSDTRLVYATMHSDFCPITSLRGRCTIKHRSEIKDLDAYRKDRDSFYYIQVFDRFIRRWYECIPTSSITNVPEKVKKALDERWKFVAIEMSRVKELTSAVKTCKRCSRYCASSDSVDCAICGNSYHMNCVQPPLPKKPSRGFAWACGPCSRATEQKREAQNNTPTVSGDVTEAEEEIIEDDDAAIMASNESTRAPSPDETAMEIDDHPATQAEIELAKMWPMRYLGIHCRVEDALQYDDRAIYPRASSRLGPRHQATVAPWYGRPVELVKSTEVKKKYMKGGNQKDKGKLAKETVAALEAERLMKAKRPKYVQDEPPGYVARGEDYPNDDPRCTAKLIFKMPEQQQQVGSPSSEQEQKHVDLDRKVTNYMRAAQPLAKKIGVPPFGVNFLDKMMEIYCTSNYNDAEALAKLAKVDRVKDMHEPVLSKAELVRFEEGVAKYGSEHRLVRLHMKTNLPHAAIVRFYYLWKKTPKGKEIWGNYPGRKGKKKLENDSSAKLHQEVAHDADDSAFDNDKALRNKRAFQCKFCNTVHSRQWRRAPGVSTGQTVLTDARTGNKDKKERLFLALCLRCANLWRKYAIEWEDIDEVNRKAASSGGKAFKRRIDEELLREQIAANEAANATPEPQLFDSSEPAKKKSKVDAAASKKTAPIVKPPTPEPPPIVPTQPQWRALPCSVCRTGGDTISCNSCKLTIHRSCYGVPEVDLLMAQGNDVWTCDQCHNDRNPKVSTEYSCCLCLTEVTDVELVESPKPGHKKKTDRDREKERLEKELADAMRSEYTNKQLSLNRPVLPREPLKKTTGNNWVHVYCAVWTPEIRFSNARALEVAEGFQLIPPSKHEAVCKLCKNKDHQNRVRSDKGACVACFQCQTPFHVSCAFEAGYQFGFDVSPVKGSRKDQFTTATLGQESGLITPAVWCKEHVVKTIIHPMHEIADETGKTALQVYVENYKQADLTLTGTVRKAQLAQLTKDKGQQALQAAQGNRRESAAHSIAAAVKRGSRQSIVSVDVKPEDGDRSDNASQPDSAERRCVKCSIDVTPRWHEIDKVVPPTRNGAPSFSQRPLSINDMTSSIGQTNGVTDLSRGGHARVNGLTTEVKPPQGHGLIVNGTGHAADPMQIDSVASSNERSAVQVNGDTRPTDKDYLCHRCFIKKKLDPTPPPELAPPRVDPSPPTFQHWNGSAPRPPHTQPQLQQHVPLPRSPWEEQTRPSQAPPPPPNTQGVPLNPYSRSPGFASSAIPPHGYNPGYHPQPPFAGMPNSASPPLPLVPPPQVHDGRQPPHPYHAQAQSRAPSFGQHRPPPLSSGFLPSGSPLPNGTNEQRPPQHAPMRSPTYPPPALPLQHNPYAPRRTESPFSTQLPSLGQPANSNPSPTLAISRPESAAQGPASLVPHSHGLSNLGASPVKMPQVAQTPAPRDHEGTPKPSSTSTGANASGASASPSLRNLLS